MTSNIDTFRQPYTTANGATVLVAAVGSPGTARISDMLQQGLKDLGMQGWKYYSYLHSITNRKHFHAFVYVV